MQDIGANDYMDNASIVPVNTWTHIAAVRSGNTLTGYGNGVAMNNPITTNSNAIAGTTTLHIGGLGDNYYQGYMDEIRLSNTARYTSAFTPSTTEFVPDSNTLLLLHGNSIDAVSNTASSTSAELQGNAGAKYYEGQATAATVLTDSGSTGHTVTKYGTASSSTSVKKFGTASWSFAGGTNTGHYHVADSTDWDVQTANGSNPHASPNGSYTFEFWMYQTAWPSTYCHMLGMGTAVQNWSAIYQNAANKRIICGWLGNWAIDFADNKLVLNQWQHIAVVKDVANTYCYIDGVETGLHPSSAARTANVWSYNSTGVGTGGLIIGGGGDYSGGSNNTMNGYLDEIRISNVARYTANFTPPTAAFTSDANTKLLLHCEAGAASGKVTRVHGTSLAWK